MVKESPYSSYRPIFRETFRDEQSVRRNGGTPTDVIFADGKGSFNGSSSKITYNLNLNGTYSVRMRFTRLNVIVNSIFFDPRGDGSGAGNIFIHTGNVLNSVGGVKYVNGLPGDALTSATKEIVVSGLTLTTVSGIASFIGSRYTDSAFLDADIDLFEIYQGTLTASEVANLYNNTWNTKHSPTNVLLDFDSTNGVLEDKTVGNPVGNNLITNGDFSSYSDGLGTGWTTISQTSGEILSKSIVTGNGFSTNAQRVEMTVDNGSSYFRIDNTGGTKPTIGKKYRIYFKYRSNKSIQVRFGLGYGVLIIPDNTGDAIVYTNIITATTADVSLYIYSPGVGSYFEFSEISLFEIRPDLSATDVSIKKIGQNYSADFNGSSSVITAGNLGTINTLNFVLYYDGSNQNGIIDLNGTNGVSHSGGTLSYFGTNAYINGVDTDTLSMGWNFITVIDTAGKNASAFRMGYNGANYFKGRLAKCQAYSGLLDLATHTQWWTEQFKDFR